MSPLKALNIHHHSNISSATIISTSSSSPPAQQQHRTPSQLEAANIAHFDALSGSHHDHFDERHHHPSSFAAEFADRLSRALRRRSSLLLVLDEDATSVLDYACGSGMYVIDTLAFASALAWCCKKKTNVVVGQVSRALAPYVAQLVGVDISPRMVEVYNTRASTQGLEPHEMRAVSSLAELHQQRFDLAVVLPFLLSLYN